MGTKTLLFLTIFTLLFTVFVFPQDASDEGAEGTKPVPTEKPGQATIEDEKQEGGPAETSVKKEEYRTVNGLENWNYTFDIAGQKKGIYNLIIKGTDKAGNVYFEGPFNIYIDPESDLPVVNISNPNLGMRVGGNELNIVGTCVDDDKTDYVEVQIDDGLFKRAEGSEFWSIVLNTEEMNDGSHTVTARGVDINGKQGYPVTVAFNLDRIKPVNTISSHTSGALLSGRAKLEGYAEDLNGIKNLFLSMDNGETYTPLKTNFDKNEKKYLFKLDIDTKKLDDGPHVYWFKSVDKTGSEGFAAFLFFVDNKNPVLEILDPKLKPDEGEEQMKVNGVFPVSGKVSDELGVQSLHYAYEKEEGDIPLIPGNPYWIKEFDFTAAKGKNAGITFTVTDTTGNVLVEKVEFPLDLDADLPVVDIVFPVAETVIPGNVAVSGFVHDDDGVKEIRYTIDKGDPVSRETREAFSFTIDNLVPGKHNLTIWGVDIYGTEGKPVLVDFFNAGDSPLITLTKVIQNLKESDFYPGIELKRDENPVLTGEMIMSDQIVSAEYTLKKGQPKKLVIKGTDPEGKKIFDIPVPGDIDFGVVDIALKVVDEYQRTTEYTSFVYITNYMKINDPPGIYIKDSRIDDNGNIKITGDNPFSFLFVGDKIKSLAFEPETNIVKVSNRDNLVMVKPSREGVSEPVRILVTTIYDEVFTSQTLRFLNDTKAPDITLDSPVTGMWVKDEAGIAGNLADSSGITKLEYSVDNLKTFNTIPIAEEGGKITFKGIAALSSYADGNISLFIKATDNAGNSGFKAVSLHKDSKNPDVVLLTPAVGDTVFTKQFTVIAQVTDNGNLDNVEISTDGERYTKIDGNRLYAHTITLSNLDELPQKIHIRAIDKSGNTAILSQNISYNRTFLESGILRVTGTDYKKDESRFKPGSMNLAITGSDSTGKISYMSSFTTGAGKESPPPRDSITSHANDVLISGNLKISGVIENSGGITEILFSGDNGYTYEKINLSFNKKNNTYTFSQNIKTADMTDGPQVFWYKTVSNSGTAGHAPFLFTVDNTPPDIQLLAPLESDILNGKISLGGKVADETGIKSFSYSMGKESGDFDLGYGNPYWTKEIDFTQSNATSAQITFTARDFTGNTGSRTLKLKLDPKTDMPVTGIVYPEQDAIVSTDSIPITGYANDDEPVSKILHSVDGGEYKSENSNGAFSLVLSDLKHGRHSVSIKAVDVNGVEGSPLKVDFFSAGPAPGAVVKSTLTQGKSSAFEPGILVQSIDGKTTLEGECSVYTTRAEFKLNDREIEKITLRTDKETGEKTFSIPVDKSLPFGRVDVFIKVFDEYSRETEYTTFFYKVDAADQSAIVDNEDFYFMDSRIDTSGNIYLGKIEPLKGLFNGRDISSIKLVPPQDNVTVTNRGSLIEVKPVKDGISEQTQIEIETVNKRIFTSRKFRFYTDIEEPVVILNTPRTEDWLNTTILFEGIAKDNIGLKSLELSLDLGQSFRSINTVPGENGFTFSETISIKHLEDGPLALVLKASDESGNTHYETIAVKKDTKKAGVSLITPKPDDMINGMITVVGAAEDAGSIEMVEFSPDGENFIKVTGTRRFHHNLDFSSYETLPEKFYFRVTDKSRNITLFEPPFTIDFEADKPVVQIQIPAEGATLKNDFVISGMVFDDDKVAAIHYSIDGKDSIKLDGSNNFEIPISLEEITDNEHVIEIQAEDIGGLKGDIARRSFKISKAEPVSVLLNPGLDVTARGEIVLKGQSTDANGIKEVYVSYDNGCTFNLAGLVAGPEEQPAEPVEGEPAAEEAEKPFIKQTEAWEYPLDTRILADGVHRLFIKAVDKTDTEGIYSTLLNLDNTSPEITLDTPKDGDRIADMMILDGRAFDNVFLDTLTLTISPINTEEGETMETKTHDLPTYGVFTKTIDLMEFTPGWYNLRIDATDKANNTSYLSRNILIQEKQIIDKIDIVFPGSGERVAGYFTIDGKVTSENSVKNVVILMNGEALKVLPVNDDGYFHITVGPDELKEGDYILEVQANISDEKIVKSGTRPVTYTHEGGWITIKNFSTGDFVTERPWLKGEAGYLLNPPEGEDKEALKAYREKVKEMGISSVMISFDNGKTFKKVSGTRKWQYRLETQRMPDGPARILVMAKFGEEASAITKTILVVDDKSPAVKMLTPEEGSQFNDTIEVLGIASDENGLADVSINLRKGDKSSYSVPAFIQGLYVEGTAIGHTYGTFGLGLTFFDQVVKFQGFAGVAPAYTSTGHPNRISGLVIGMKILANILSLPFDYFFGPDWEFFSIEAALGANFAYYSNTGEEITFGGDNSKILGSFLTQLEFKFRFKKLSMFSTYSLFTEFAVALIPSDVEGAPSLDMRIGFGLRIGIF
ncbi:MAG: hypothetical protein JXB88_23310 [Spirochaetales bacterium]|nr:hypothetical protein [Spirochaetales bacterium]